MNEAEGGFDPEATGPWGRPDHVAHDPPWVRVGRYRLEDLLEFAAQRRKTSTSQA